MATDPIPDDLTTRAGREARLGQRGCVVWLYGLSGAGKSTLAQALERRLAEEGLVSRILDGDELRRGLCHGLGYSDEARHENIRRAAEVARILAHTGIITIAAFICPRRELRELARTIIGEEDFVEVFVKTSFETCARRDVKGLYAKAASGEVSQFTGRDSAFEEPETISSAYVIDTERAGIASCTERLCDIVLPRVRPRQRD
jgi:adenylylsulfate kinase